MDFIRRTIIDYETVITKELLDSFQDGIIEAITKAEAALAIQPAIYNASTHNDFPSVGNSTTIYKAESEKLLYQWNSDELKYEPLCQGDSCNCFDDGATLDGGSASGLNGSDGETVILNGGVASGIGE